MSDIEKKLDTMIFEAMDRRLYRLEKAVFEGPTHQAKECGRCDVCGYDYQRYCREHMQGRHENCKEPSPSPERCGCEQPECDGSGKRKPSDAVEAKIKQIQDFYEIESSTLLRDLVDVAWRSK